MSLEKGTIDTILLNFRMLRIAVVSELESAELSDELRDIKRTLENQFLVNIIAFAGLIVAIVQVILGIQHVDLTLIYVSSGASVLFVIVLGYLAWLSYRGGKEAKLKQITHDISNSNDEVNEYGVLLATAKENVLPAIEDSYNAHLIDQATRDLMAKRINLSISFFDRKIAEAQERIKKAEEDRNKLKKP